MNVGGRWTSHGLPAIGTAEHTALLSESLDLDELERAAGWTGFERPTSGSPASWFGHCDGAADQQPPAAVRQIDSEPPAEVTASWVLPDEDPLPAVSTNHAPGPAVMTGPAVTHHGGLAAKALRVIGPVGKPLSGDALGVNGLVPSPRPAAERLAAGRRRPATTGSRVLPPPPVVAGPPTGALRMSEVAEALAATGPILVGAQDPTPTGELVRPFVTETGLGDWASVDAVPPPVSVDVFQRSVRAGLKRDAIATRTDGRVQERDPVTPPNPWAASASQVPTRRQLRAKEKAFSSTRAVTARRIAKGGVLAVTALGVVATVSPQALHALGLAGQSGPLTRGATDLSAALPPSQQRSAQPLAHSALQDQLSQRLSQRLKLRLEIADQAADDATHAALGAGAALIDLAKAHDAAVSARQQAAVARVARDVARDPQSYAAQVVADHGWSVGEFQCLGQLWTRESNWNYQASNSSSGAYGIAQALPGSKMASIASDWQTNPVTQIKWGINYITERYGTPCGAWAHSQANGWY
jgi:hypothetical protein